jgi:hypothetical protein
MTRATGLAFRLLFWSRNCVILPMTKQVFFVFSVVYLFGGCQQADKKENKEAAPTDSTAKNPFFPVADYIRSEISLVDSTPYGLVQYRISAAGKKDTSFVKTADFDRLAQEFLPPELGDSVFEKQFQESSFIDQSTQSVTFTYAAKNDRPGLQRIDVLAKQDPDFQKVKSIYMEKNELRSDTNFVWKMIWMAKHSFQIIQIRRVSNQPPVTEQVKIVWDPVE